jgi:DNA invertase Pin-like site-specific DNA recombinase
MKTMKKKTQTNKKWVKLPGTSKSAMQQEVHPVKKNEKTVGVAYARTSSFGKKVQGSRARQVEQAFAAADGQGLKVHSAIAEVISGYAKYEKRDTLKKILERQLPGLPEDKQKTVFLFVESVRALARNSMVSEQIYLTSKANNVTIIPHDYPTLFTHQETPTGNFVRKLVCSLQELDRDTLVWRLAHGREQKKKSTTAKTQSGKPKVNGTKSYLEEMKPSAKVQNQILALGKQRSKGTFGWRPMAKKVSKILGLKDVLPHETVRRMHDEIIAKK